MRATGKTNTAPSTNNDLLTDKAADSNNLIQEKYITISVEKKNIEEARTFFNRVHADLTNGLARLDSAIREVITISASSTSYINALDISAEYGDGSNPLGLKSDFIMSLCEQIMGMDGIDARAKSIIDRARVEAHLRRENRIQQKKHDTQSISLSLIYRHELTADDILADAGAISSFVVEGNVIYYLQSGRLYKVRRLSGSETVLLTQTENLKALTYQNGAIIYEKCFPVY